VQSGIAKSNASSPPDRRIEFRIGINVGDIVVEDGDIFGNGVNVAARLEALAQPGGICVSRVVYDQVRDQLDFAFENMGEQQVKNIARPVRVYRILLGEKHRSSEPGLYLMFRPRRSRVDFRHLSAPFSRFPAPPGRVRYRPAAWKVTARRSASAN
jgi:hypothetical protein